MALDAVCLPIFHTNILTSPVHVHLFLIAAGKKSKKGGSKSSQEAQEVEELYDQELASDSDSDSSDSDSEPAQPYKPKEVTRGKELENQIAQRKRYEEARDKVKAKRPKKKRKTPPVTDEELGPANKSGVTSFITQAKTARRASGPDSIASDSDLTDKENMPATRRTAAEKAAQEAAQKAEAENAKLRQAIAGLEENQATVPENQTELDNVTIWAKRVMFCKYQFAYKEADLARITKKIYFKMHTKEQQLQLGPGWMPRWIRTYTPTVKKAFSDSRGYRCQELRKICHKYAKEHEDLPTSEDILRCMTGDINLEDQDEVLLMAWVWDKCWPAVAMAANWGLNTRRHNLMHMAKCPYDGQVSNVRLALMAFFVCHVFCCLWP